MRFKKCVAVISFMASSLAFAGSDLKADQSFVQELEAGIQNLDTSFIQELNKQIRIEAAVYNVSLDQRSSFQKAISEISSIGYQDIKEGESVDASAIVVNLVHEGVDVKDHLLNTESVEFISDVKLGSYHSMTSLPGGSISFDSTLESSYLADVIDDTYIPGAVNQGYRVQLKPKLKDREISLGYRLDSTGLLNSDEFIKHSGASKFVPVLFSQTNKGNVSIKEGQSLVISGLPNLYLKKEDSPGVWDSLISWFDFGEEAQNSEVLSVMVLTPTFES